MKGSYLQLLTESKWVPEHHPAIRLIAPVWQHWLLDRGSLTERLMALSDGGFSVKVLSQRWDKPLIHEAQQLNIRSHLVARIREVELYCGNVCMVFARSVMPLQVYNDQRYVLQNIGTRPLGQLLFKDGKMRVNKRGVSRHPSADGTIVYGRSTPYRYAEKEILVSEFFINPSLVENADLG